MAILYRYDGMLKVIAAEIMDDDLTVLAELAGKLDVRQAVVLAGRILEHLEALHEMGFLHLDISPENILMITNVFLLVFSGLCLLPEIYVGIQGLRVAKNLKSSKGHIIWAVILLSFSALSLMGTLIAMVKEGSFSAHGSTLFSTLLELIVYFEYIQYAVAFRKELLMSAE